MYLKYICKHVHRLKKRNSKILKLLLELFNDTLSTNSLTEYNVNFNIISSTFSCYNSPGSFKHLKNLQYLLDRFTTKQRLSRESYTVKRFIGRNAKTRVNSEM